MSRLIAATRAAGEPAPSTGLREQVVYLFGAGASHACAKAVDSPHGILMRDLTSPLLIEVKRMVDELYADEPRLTDLINTVIDDDTDIEHVITFLDKSSSRIHKRFAGDLRAAFVKVLQERLRRIEVDYGSPPVNLYAALFDMYEVDGLQEELKGILTLNYDEYIEDALKTISRSVDFGIDFQGPPPVHRSHRLIKLHGSFGWKHSWPVTPLADSDEDPLWIPPGIQKVKDEYPFNILWGLARELLDCDVLRIVGCNLRANDWDLVSLLFSTRHVHGTRPNPYRVELIDAPRTAERLQYEFPYLDVRSIYESEPAGSRLLFEVTSGTAYSYRSMTEEEKTLLRARDIKQNWFRAWLKHMAEGLNETMDSVSTTTGTFERFLEEI